MLTKHRLIMQGTAIFGVLLTVLTFGGCGVSTSASSSSTGSSSSNTASAEYKYGTVEFPKSSSLCSSPIGIALAKGFFKEEGINDKALIVKLFKSYDYGVGNNGAAQIEDDVKFFSQGLKQIGFLKTNDPDAFAKNACQKIDLS